MLTASLVDSVPMTSGCSFGFGSVKRLGQVNPFGKDALTPAQTQGIRYENRVGKVLAKEAALLGAELWSHEWIEYNGRLCQPDFVMVFPSESAILFEVKLSWVDCSRQFELYKRVLHALGLGPITCVTVCRNLRPGIPREQLIRSLVDVEPGSIWQLRI